MAKKINKQEKALRNSARGACCTVRMTGVCNFQTETVVLAHLNGAGIGAKHDGIFGAFACSNCHAWLDFGYVRTHTKQQRDYEHYRAMHETQQHWFDSGLLVVKC
ncbi:MAG: DUF1364 domain-containing protein [Gammaproteobacteria bacterium]|nr:MAG: DUF1364 domain-containing protein [Gammaproteobacteria bacterium]